MFGCHACLLCLLANLCCSAWPGTTGMRHFPFLLSIFKYAGHQLGLSDPSCMFSLGDYLIYDPYAPTYPIH